MMRKGCHLLILSVLAGAGCLAPMTPWEDESKPLPVQTAAAPPAPPIVTPDEITEANASEKVRAFARELDFAENEGTKAGPAVKLTATKP